MFIGIQLLFVKVNFKFYLIYFVKIPCRKWISLGPLGTPSAISRKILFLVWIFCHTILWSRTLWWDVCLIKFLFFWDSSTWLKFIPFPLLICSHPLPVVLSLLSIGSQTISDICNNLPKSLGPILRKTWPICWLHSIWLEIHKIWICFIILYEFFRNHIKNIFRPSLKIFYFINGHTFLHLFY